MRRVGTAAARGGPHDGGVRPGPNNALTDVAGLRVGHARVPDALSGTTVVLAPPGGAVAGVDVRGAAPGTRETDLLDPRNTVQRVHAVVLSGGSAFGLAAADGVMARLAAAGVGFPVPGAVVPIVPAAVLFDLGRGGPADDPALRPTAATGAAAVDAASGGPVAQGVVGAGTGALIGGLKGGIGTASAVLDDGTTVAALAAVNAAGSAVDLATGGLHGVRLGLPDEFVQPRVGAAAQAALRAVAESVRPRLGTATTLAVVATDATLDKAGCGRLAAMGHDGLARTLAPVHTVVDGDLVFGLATCARPVARPGRADGAARRRRRRRRQGRGARGAGGGDGDDACGHLPVVPRGRGDLRLSAQRPRPGGCCGSMTAVEPADLAEFLAEHPPFDSLGPEALDEIARAARVERFDDGALIHDAFHEPTDEVFVVVAGQVDLLWNDGRQVPPDPADILGPGGVFGFRAMLTERSIGPRAVAIGAATVARIPASLAGPAFATRRGARFLVETMVAGPSGRHGRPELQQRRRPDRARTAARGPGHRGRRGREADDGPKRAGRGPPRCRAVRAGHGRGAAGPGPGRRQAAHHAGARDHGHHGTRGEPGRHRRRGADAAAGA